MRSRAALIVACLAAGHATGQNEFMIFPERNGSSATFTSRSSNNVVESFTEVAGKLFAGVGDDGRSCRVRGLYHWATDENAATRESFRVIFRRPAATGGGPDTSATGIIARTGPLLLPGGNGRRGWRLNVTFSPIAVPCTGGFFMGVELAAAPGWPGGDGHSVWDARYNPPANRAIGDNPRAGAPQHAWSNDNGTTRNHPWIWRIGAFVDNPVLNVGGIDPSNTRQSPAGSSNYGAGGMYPDIGGSPRRDGLDLRVEARSAPNAVAFGFVAGSFMNTPIPILGLGGRLYIDVLTFTSIGSAPFSGNVATIPVARPASLPTFLKGTVVFQAVAFDPTTRQGSISNGQGTSF